MARSATCVGDVGMGRLSLAYHAYRAYHAYHARGGRLWNSPRCCVVWMRMLRLAFKLALTLAFTLGFSGAAQAQPANDTCQGAVSFEWEALPWTSPAVSIAAAAAVEEAVNPCITSGFTVWYRFTAESNSEVEVSTCVALAAGTTAIDTVLGLYEAEAGVGCSSVVPVWCADDSCAFRAALSYPVRDGVTYYIQAGLFSSGAGQLPPPTGDDILAVHVRLINSTPGDEWEEGGGGGGGGGGGEDAGSLPGFAEQIVSSAGDGPVAIRGELTFEGDIDVFAFDICDLGAFEASTVGQTQVDTQLFLFDAGGRGVAMNDDNPGASDRQSRVTIPGAGGVMGTYYLAITAYNQDATDVEGRLIWNNEPFRSNRAPDGPGLDGSVAGWTLAGGDRGAYRIALRGASVRGACSCSPCIADFDANGGVDGADVEGFFTSWSRGDVCGDVNEDGGVDGPDVEEFFTSWSQGLC